MNHSPRAIYPYAAMMNHTFKKQAHPLARHFIRHHELAVIITITANAHIIVSDTV